LQQVWREQIWRADKQRDDLSAIAPRIIAQIETVCHTAPAERALKPNDRDLAEKQPCDAPDILAF
jgi:hypothetical protein